MSLSIPFYNTPKPSLNELVLLVVSEHCDTHIKGSLVEYECDVFINYADASKKKRPNWNKIVPIGTPMVGRVDDLCHTAKTDKPIVNVSISYLYDKETNAETLLEKFNKNKSLISMIKNVSHKFDISVEKLWEDIIYNVDIMRRDEYEDDMPFLIDYIVDTITLATLDTTTLDTITLDTTSLYDTTTLEELFEDFENKTMYKYFIDLLGVYSKDRVINITTKIEIISTGSIMNTKDIISQCISKLTFPYTFKYTSTPVFVLESSSVNSTKEDHTNFVNMLSNLGNIMVPKTFVRIQ